MFSQKYFNSFFHLIRSSTKIIQFDHVAFHETISFEDGVGREFLDLTVTVCFQKNECFQNVKFLTLFLKSISYNNVVVR